MNRRALLAALLAMPVTARFARPAVIAVGTSAHSWGTVQGIGPSGWHFVTMVRSGQYTQVWTRAEGETVSRRIA